MNIFSVKTNVRNQMIDITSEVQSVVSNKNVKSGICMVFVPHTTAAVTINESADPDVRTDIISFMSKLIPNTSEFKHLEGNSDSHIKTSFFGSSETIIIENGRLVLGTWQNVYFCEFDGPRIRKVYVKIIRDEK